MNVHVDAVQTNSLDRTSLWAMVQCETTKCKVYIYCIYTFLGYAICIPTVLFMLPITFLKQMGEQLRELLCILQTIQSSVLQWNGM
jgi:hypothetical protein